MTRLPNSRRLAAWLVAAAAVLVAVVLVGRWERNRNVHAQNVRMEAVYRKATADGFVSRLLDGYRLDWSFDCLLYHAPGHPKDISDYELCFDPNGRLVQTVDRSSGTPSFADLHSEPSRTAVRVPVPRILAAFKALGGSKDPRLAGVGLHQATLPVRFADIGVVGPPPPTH